MWPFTLIPETIDPTLRIIIIALISVQFIAFLGYMIILCREHKRHKEANKEEVKTEEHVIEKAQKESAKKESHPYDDNTQKPAERSSSKTKKKLD